MFWHGLGSACLLSVQHTRLCLSQMPRRWPFHLVHDVRCKRSHFKCEAAVWELGKKWTDNSSVFFLFHKFDREYPIHPCYRSSWTICTLSRFEAHAACRRATSTGVRLLKMPESLVFVGAEKKTFEPNARNRYIEVGCKDTLSDAFSRAVWAPGQPFKSGVSCCAFLEGSRFTFHGK